MDIEALARKYYRAEGQNSWHHIQQVLTSARRIARRLWNREITPVEETACLFHDCAVMSMKDKAHHGAASARIAEAVLSDAFEKSDLRTIVTAIVEHDSDDNPDRKASSSVSALVQAADFNQPEAAWVLNKSYAYGLKKGWSRGRCVENATANAAKYINGSYAYPELYREAYAKELGSMIETFRSLQEQKAAEIIDAYRKRHGLGPEDLRLPDPEI